MKGAKRREERKKKELEQDREARKGVDMQNNKENGEGSRQVDERKGELNKRWLKRGRKGELTRDNATW